MISNEKYNTEAFIRRRKENEIEDAAFSRKLDRLIKGTLTDRALLTVCRTPNVIELAIGKDLSGQQLKIKPSTLRKAMRYGRDIGPETVKSIFSAIRKPMMLLSGVNPNSAILLSEIQDGEGNPGAAAVYIVGDGDQEVRIDRIISIYGRENLQAYIDRNMQMIIAINKEKVNKLAQNTGVQFPAPETAAYIINDTIAETFAFIKESVPETNHSPRLYIDMDGTLCVFNREAETEDLYRKGYFENLPPHENVLDGIRLFRTEHPEAEVYILSSFLSDSAFAYEEKNTWIDRYLPEVDSDHRLLIPYGEPKRYFIPDGIRETDYLIDDYTRNLIDWEQGGTGIKLINGINNTHGTWAGNSINYKDSPTEIANTLEGIAEGGLTIQDPKFLRQVQEDLLDEMDRNSEELEQLLFAHKSAESDEERLKIEERATYVFARQMLMYEKSDYIREQRKEYNMAADEKKSVREKLAEKFIATLESDEPLSWTQGWIGGAPENLTTGVRYRGVNRFVLSLVAAEKGYSDPRWCSYKQAEEKGYHVNKGEKGTQVEYWLVYDEKEKKCHTLDEARRIIRRDPEREEDLHLTPRYFYVFNAKQMTGVPELNRHSFDADIVADRFIDKLKTGMGIEVYEDAQSAYYSPARDEIHIPPRENFLSQEEYYSTELHELAHSTGHESRLNRELSHEREAYAIEELRAEIASAYVSAEIGIPMSASEIENHQAYVQSWAKAIRDNKNVLFQAMNAADKISDYMEQTGTLFDIIKEYEAEKVREKTPEPEILNFGIDSKDNYTVTYRYDNREQTEVLQFPEAEEGKEDLTKLQFYLRDPETGESHRVILPEADRVRFGQFVIDDEQRSSRDAAKSGVDIVTNEDGKNVYYFDNLSRAQSQALTDAIEMKFGISLDQAKLIAASPSLSADEMKDIAQLTADMHLPDEAVRVMSDTSYTADQRVGLWQGYHDGISIEDAGLYARRDLDYPYMIAVQKAIKDNIPKDRIEAYAKPEIFTEEKFSAIMDGYRYKLPDKVIEMYAKPEFSDKAMYTYAMAFSMIQSAGYPPESFEPFVSDLEPEEIVRASRMFIEQAPKEELNSGMTFAEAVAAREAKKAQAEEIASESNPEIASSKEIDEDIEAVPEILKDGFIPTDGLEYYDQLADNSPDLNVPSYSADAELDV